MTARLRNKVAAVAVLAATVALAAGCGGGDDDSGDEAEASFEDAQLEFAQCMRENGVDFPDPEPGQEGFQFRAGEEGAPDLGSDAFQAAQEECSPIIEDAIPEGERPDPAEVQDRLHQLTECLRDRGYDVPEPRIVTPGSDSGPPEDAGEFRDELEQLQDDPEFRAAEEECSEQADLDELRPGSDGEGGDDGP